MWIRVVVGRGVGSGRRGLGVVASACLDQRDPLVETGDGGQDEGGEESADHAIGDDEQFVTAVKATGRKKLIMTALWTEACLSFTALDALREGNEVYPVVDAVGGTSVEAHRAALERIVQAGAQPPSVVQLLCELQRDWARTETVQPVTEILFAIEGR